jgi:hypothetical protein
MRLDLRLIDVKEALMKKLVFLMFLAAVLLVPAASAGTLALDITTNTGNVGTTYSWSLGWQFTVNSSITVDGLAFYDNTDRQNHDVGIFDNGTQTLLVSATVPACTLSIGTAPWCVQSVTPYVLGVGTYDIMAVTGNDNYTWSPLTLTTIPQISFVQDEFYNNPPSAALTFPNQSDGSQGFFGPSFTVQEGSGVPEPASVLLIGGGLLLAAGLRRRRHA